MDTRKRQLRGGKQKQTIGKVDPFLITFAVVMITFGAVMIFDASVYQANITFGDQYYFLKQHLSWLFIGGALGLITYLTPYKAILKLSPILFITIIILLISVLIFGDAVNGSRRWFSIGTLPIQPAEFVKPVLIVYLAAILGKFDSTSKKKKLSDSDTFKKRLLVFGIPTLLTLLLIILEPDLGTTLLIGGVALGMFFLSDNSKAHINGTLGLLGGFGVLATMAGLLASYRMQRVKTFLQLLFKGVVEDPNGSGYQINQILIGIGSGGFLGKGFGQSRQRFGYLVENTAFTDSIFAVILEELGYLGGIIFVSLWAAFMWKVLKLAQSIEDRAGSLIVAGIGLWFTLQTFLNMGANVGLIPLTGIPLPFFTYGGSNTLVTMVGLGLLLNISRYATENRNK
jgi:cell division protein FtsW